MSASEAVQRAAAASAARTERAALGARERAQAEARRVLTDRHHARVLVDLEAELIGQVRRTTPRITDTALRRFAAWAAEPVGEAERADRVERLERAAALTPSCEVEWETALALAGADATDGFDLEAHVKAIAAVVRRVRRLA